MLSRKGTSLLFFIFLSIYFFSLDAGKKRDSNRPEKQYQIDGQVIIDLLGGQDIEYQALWDQYNNHEITSYELKKIIVGGLETASRELLICNDVELTLDEYLEGFLNGCSLQLEQAEKRFLKNTIEKIKKEFNFQVKDECARWNFSREWALLKCSDIFDLIGDALVVLFEQKSDKSQLPEFMLIVSNLQMRDCTKMLIHSLMKNELHQNVIVHHPNVLHRVLNLEGQERHHSHPVRSFIDNCEYSFFLAAMSPLIFVLILEIIVFYGLQEAIQYKYS